MHPRVVAQANNTGSPHETLTELASSSADDPTLVPSTLNGIAYLADALWSLDYDLVRVPQTESRYAIAPPIGAFALSLVLNAGPDQATGYNKYCASKWKDPRDDIFAALNELSMSKHILTRFKCVR